jgi:hypothetical protein
MALERRPNVRGAGGAGYDRTERNSRVRCSPLNSARYFVLFKGSTLYGGHAPRLAHALALLDGGEVVELMVRLAPLVPEHHQPGGVQGGKRRTLHPRAPLNTAEAGAGSTPSHPWHCEA